MPFVSLGRDEIVQTSCSPFRPSLEKKYLGDLLNMKTISYVRHGRSFAVGSGRLPWRRHTMGDRNTHPRRTISSATRHGIPIIVFLGTPNPLASTARKPNRRARFFLSAPFGWPLA